MLPPLTQKTGLTSFVHIQCESKKVAAPQKTFCYIFNCGEPV